jgi:hypothetical protein
VRHFVVLLAFSQSIACSVLFGEATEEDATVQTDGDGGSTDAGDGQGGDGGPLRDAAPPIPDAFAGDVLTQRIRIASGNDDGFEIEVNGNTQFSTASNYLGFGPLGANLTGLRFMYSVPNNAVLVGVKIQFTAKEGSAASARVNIRPANDNSQFVMQKDELSNRLGSGTVEWTIPSWTVDAALDAQLSPELSSVVSSTWQDDGAIVFLFEAVQGLREAYSFEDGAQLAPELILEYYIP